MVRLDHALVSCLLSATLCLAPGCGAPAQPPVTPSASSPSHSPHDHGHEHEHGDHHHAETLEQAIVQLEKSLADVAMKLTGEAKIAADETVHEIGHLLEDLDVVIGKQDLAAELKESGKKAVAELMDCFDKIDLSLHAGAGEGESPAAVHASVAERIKAALASLKGLSKRPSTSEEQK